MIRNLMLYPAELRGLPRFLRLSRILQFRSSGTERSQRAHGGTIESQNQAQTVREMFASRSFQPANKET